MSERPDPGDGRCCVTGALHAGTTRGAVEAVGGIQTYVSRPPAPPAPGTPAAAAAVVILTDVFGMVLPNVRLLADRLARDVGVTVYVPDLFGGDAFPADLLTVDTPPTVWRSITNACNLLAVLPRFLAFVRRHPDATVHPITAAVFPAVTAAHGGPGVARIGVLGYCFGGRYTVLAGATPAVTAIATAHPSMVALPGDVEAVTVPALYMLSATDFLMSAAQMAQLRALAADRNARVPTQVMDFPGTVHGFAVRGDDAIPATRAARELATVTTGDFFRRHLLPAAVATAPAAPAAATADGDAAVPAAAAAGGGVPAPATATPIATPTATPTASASGGVEVGGEVPPPSLDLE